MKKIICTLMVLVMTLTCFAACGKTDATKNVESVIKGIDEIGTDSGAKLSEAQSAYNALSDEEKDKVKNYDDLEEAMSKYNSLTDMNDSIADIIAKSEAGYTSKDFDIAGLLAKAEEIKTSYNAMNDTEKAQIADFDKLDAACAKLKTYSDTALSAAAVYVKAFNAVNAGKNYTVTNVYCIKQIRNTNEEYHFFALKYKDAAGAEASVYANARFLYSESVYDSIVNNPTVFFAAAPASEENDAIKNGNVTLDVNAVLAAAK